MSWEPIPQKGEEDRYVVARTQREKLLENLAVARQCREAADYIQHRFPVAARLLRHEAEKFLA